MIGKLKDGSRCATLAAVALLVAAGSLSRPEPASANSTTFVSALQLRQIFTGAEMPTTERAAIGPGGRVFVSSGNDIFEVVKNGEGGFDRRSIAQASVTLPTGEVVPGAFVGLKVMGRVVYATATAFAPPPTPTSPLIPLASMLYRIELDTHQGVRRISAAPFTGHAIPFLPNGLALDHRGHIFIANSFSAVTGEAAIIKITVTNSDPLAFTEAVWLPAAAGGALPNGLQIRGRQVFLSSLNVVFRIDMDQNGDAGTPTLIFQADPDVFLDDFALLPGVIAIAVADNPQSPPVTDVSQITFFSTRPGHVGEVIDVFPLAGSVAFPSSVTLALGGTFPPGALLVTDIVAGGLYELTFH